MGQIVDISTLNLKEENYAPTDFYVVNELIECALTYFDHNDELYYGNNAALDDSMGVMDKTKKAIDCSTFVCLCLNGVPYEKSRYALGGGKENNISVYPWAENIYDTGENNYQRYANRIAKYFYETGRLFAPNPQFTNIRMGDLLFWEREDLNDGSFCKIGHVAIALNITNNGKIRYMEVTENGGPVRIAATTIETNENIILAARPFYNAVSYEKTKNIIYGNHPEILTADGLSYRTLDNIEKGYYTVVISGKGKNNPEVSPIAEIDEGAISTANLGKDIFVAQLRVTSPENTLRLKVSQNKEFLLNWVALYKGFIQNPLPYYTEPEIRGAYIKSYFADDYDLDGTFALMPNKNKVGADFQNLFQLDGDGCIVCKEKGKYLAILKITIKEQPAVQADIITFKESEEQPVVIDSMDFSGTDSFSENLICVLNMEKNEKIGCRIKGGGKVTAGRTNTSLQVIKL